jgi:nitroreductase
MALHACRSYVDFHLAHGIDISREFPELETSVHLPPPGQGISTLNKNSAELVVAAKGDYESLAMSRCSVRQFAEQPVDPSLVRDAVRIAQKCPSVCNRQTAHAWILQKKEFVQAVLRVQQGSKGFSQQVNTVIVVTSCLECFDGSKERNQGFIDGGLFAMSLMHALHYKGLAVCPLNWSSGRTKDRALRNTIPIPDSHIVVMLLAVGHYPKSFPVANSPRRNLDEVLFTIGQS